MVRRGGGWLFRSSAPGFLEGKEMAGGCMMEVRWVGVGVEDVGICVCVYGGGGGVVVMRRRCDGVGLLMGIWGW